MCINKDIIKIIVVLIVVVSVVEAQYEDVRCKCVCPLLNPPQTNSTSKTTRKVYVKSFPDPSKCKCDLVVEPRQPESFCQRCDCQWQRRNTITIKLVVMFIICVVSLLVLYMLFLLCLDPLLNKRSMMTYEQHHEDVNMTRMSAPRSLSESSTESRSGVISRMRSGVSRITGEQEKWKGTVREQRRHIYERHTILN